MATGINTMKQASHHFRSLPALALPLVIGLALSFAGCGGDNGDETGPGRRSSGGPPEGGGKGRGGRDSGGRGGRGDPEAAAAAVPVEVVRVDRSSISSYLETNGVLEAENDVSIVARTAGPIVKLEVEEGMRVREGQVLLEIDETERLAEVEIARVALEDAKRAHERAKAARDAEIISQEVYDAALNQLESAEARLKSAEILHDYTMVRAPFDGVVVERFVKLAENVTVNQPLFRITDFDPLLCKIQIPEKELSRLEIGQRALLKVEAWPDERFVAKLLRISPVVEATTGTIRVTLEVTTGGKLRPGMFASVFLETDTHQNALTIPKAALSIDSLSDSVFVAKDGEAERRAIEIGFEESDRIEILSGLSEGEPVVVVGQDGLTNGTPLQIIAGPGAESGPGQRRAAEPAAVPARPERGDGERAGPGPGGGRGARDVDFSKLSPEELEKVKERMRERGLSEERIEEIIRRRSGQP